MRSIKGKKKCQNYGKMATTTTKYLRQTQREKIRKEKLISKVMYLCLFG